MDRIVLDKIYTRERPLFYYFMWNESDRLGYKYFLDHKIKNNLFLKKSTSEKISVWYDQNELNKINKILFKLISKDNKLLKKISSRVNKYGDLLINYLNSNKKINNSEDFEEYYKFLVRYWSAMNIIFIISNSSSNTKKEIINDCINIRIKYEKYSSRMFKMVVDFCKEKNIDKELIKYLTPMEIYGLLKVDISLVKKRKYGFGLYNGKIYLKKSLYKKLKEKNIVLNSKIFLYKNQIKGTVAYKGKARGRIRLILSNRDLIDFKNKEILVTEMTEPNFINVLKKASAIVTDEGGMTCHAAIVARELKKPCIIGTKFATKVFKDGDMVEVNEDEGIVRKI